MSSQQITKLRKEGKIQEAFELAQQLLQSDAENIWNRRAMAWVYYELLKKDTEANNFDAVLEKLSATAQLKLPENENVFYKNIAWLLARYLNKHAFSSSGLDKLFKLIRDFRFPKPEAGYTFLLKSFTKHAAEWGDFIGFVHWWGLQNFLPENYEPTQLQNGKEILSDVERVYISISKHLLKNPLDKEQTEWFLPYISDICANYPQMQYPHYYHAKLLLASGNKERFLKAFIPFARKKKSDFWVWDLMSEIFDENDSRYFACLCRSLSCKAKVKFNLNVKEKFAERLMHKGMLAEAKHEIDEIVNCRNQEGWKIPGRVHTWLKNESIAKAIPVKSNTALYQKYAPDANQILFYDLRPGLVVVEKVNPKHQIIHFVAEGKKHGSFLYRGFKLNPAPGNIYSVRFLNEKDPKNALFYKAATIESTDKTVPESLLKTIGGKINIRQGNSFGFVASVFVPPDIVQKHKLNNGDTIKATALLAYNKAKKNWSFKVVELLK